MGCHLKLALHGVKSAFRLAVTVHEAEWPIVNRMTAREPVVGEREEDGSGESIAESGFDMPSCLAGALSTATPNHLLTGWSWGQRMFRGVRCPPRIVRRANPRQGRKRLGLASPAG